MSEPDIFDPLTEGGAETPERVAPPPTLIVVDQTQVRSLSEQGWELLRVEYEDQLMNPANTSNPPQVLRKALFVMSQNGHKAVRDLRDRIGIYQSQLSSATQALDKLTRESEKELDMLKRDLDRANSSRDTSEVVISNLRETGQRERDRADRAELLLNQLRLSLGSINIDRLLGITTADGGAVIAPDIPPEIQAAPSPDQPPANSWQRLREED